ncbi:hypothetical protein [Novosphingobium sp. Leaf2]|uniref:hypothetical protein n=1 Tax=Novosphingobium sp. Leaf2 TaxID=1735670 RepID=UPI000A468F25|nr:hypothetical protein [Novosphingobium sp. Leaf2]
MPPEIHTETRRIAAMPRLGLIAEAEVTTITDLRDTPFGTYDFGTETVSAIRWVKEHD